jgi:hypothetical protein
MGRSEIMPEGKLPPNADGGESDDQEVKGSGQAAEGAAVHPSYY